MIVRFNQGWFRSSRSTAMAGCHSVSVAFYLVAQRELYPDWRSRLNLPFLMAAELACP
jgi:hypothetical protein